jgi:hypothetical protein
MKYFVTGATGFVGGRPRPVEQTFIEMLNRVMARWKNKKFGSFLD